tara:strand:+ start:517 stop:729 length:213 start_codon:yes stop_codon:yes gene_type:complete
MIKFFKKIICKIFHIKQCSCLEEIDEHIEYFTKVPEPEIPVLVLEDHCEKHNRFRKKCPECIAIKEGANT